MNTSVRISVLIEVNNLQILRISNLDLRENHKRRILLAVTFRLGNSGSHVNPFSWRVNPSG